MNGFSLKHNNEAICAALETGSIGIVISNKDGEFSISFNGMDSQGIYYEWYNQKICTNDSITVKYEHINESTVSQPISIRDMNNKKVEDKLLLNSYFKLKQELLDEGLISL